MLQEPWPLSALNCHPLIFCSGHKAERSRLLTRQPMSSKDPKEPGAKCHCAGKGAITSPLPGKTQLRYLKSWSLSPVLGNKLHKKRQRVGPCLPAFRKWIILHAEVKIRRENSKPQPTFIPTTMRQLSTRAKESCSRDGCIGASASLLAIGESQRAEPRGAAPASPAVPAAGSMHCLYSPRAAPSTYKLCLSQGGTAPPFVSASVVPLTIAQKHPPASQHRRFTPEHQHCHSLHWVKLWWSCCFLFIQLYHAQSCDTFSPSAQ